MSKVKIISEFWDFIKVRKKYWLPPIAVILVGFRLFIVVIGNMALAPFIYALF